ncbi:MAG TPA: hypothetical protein VG125_13655 [Pirellulales bacterium]|jgi:hypothetical protein|nr:hypothetical protein [Pirellulales bacterium]
MRKILFLTAALFFPAVAMAQVPAPEPYPPDHFAIAGPASARPGEMMVFTFQAGDPQPSAVKWTIIPADTLGFLGDGDRAIFNERTPGEYMLIAAASHAGGVAIDYWHIHVGTSGVTTHGPAGTAPSYMPAAVRTARRASATAVVPSVVAKAAEAPDGPEAMAHEWAAEMHSKVVRVEAPILAGIFRSTAALAAAGEIKTIDDLFDRTTDGVEKALGKDGLIAWASWFDHLERYLVAVSDPPTLTSSVRGLRRHSFVDDPEAAAPVALADESNAATSPAETVEDFVKPTDDGPPLNIPLERCREIWLAVAAGLDRS